MYVHQQRICIFLQVIWLIGNDFNPVNHVIMICLGSATQGFWKPFLVLYPWWTLYLLIFCVYAGRSTFSCLFTWHTDISNIDAATGPSKIFAVWYATWSTQADKNCLSHSNANISFALQHAGDLNAEYLRQFLGKIVCPNLPRIHILQYFNTKNCSTSK